ncbi:MAG: acyl-CoA dehydrogenase [SAR202 cluster bacterium]|nr:acyl-CoA dehydrogenase [SAR202 cluster bacterium]|tara:strand:+ start:3907 stop:5043 length:1137 start_codon:yes stop_codon:yes gene_type:complete
MDLALTDEQTMLKTAAADFLSTELPKERTRELFDSETGFAPDLWEKIGQMGWASMLIPEEYGGQGADLATTGVLYEEMGARLCPSPHLSSAVLSALTILSAGSDAQKQSLLPPIANGDQIVAFAFTEDETKWGPDSIQLDASRQNGSYVLNGAKSFIPDAHVADSIMVVARTSSGDNGDGITCFLVDKDAAGLAVRTQTGWLGEVMNEVTLDGVTVADSAVIGDVGGAWSAVQKALDAATGVLCAYMVGGCREVLEMTVEYTQTRIQFGVPIGNFQRVQDHVIDALNMEQATRWTTYEALWKLDEGMPDAAVAISMAKAVASDGYFKACEAAHHVHAGVGVDMDYGLAFYTQKARTLQHYLGDAVHHRRRMAELMSDA